MDRPRTGPWKTSKSEFERKRIIKDRKVTLVRGRIKIRELGKL